MQVDLASRGDRSQLCAALRRVVHPSLALEIWDEERLLLEVSRIFGVKAAVIDEASLLSMRQAVQSTTAQYAFRIRFAPVTSSFMALSAF